MTPQRPSCVLLVALGPSLALSAAAAQTAPTVSVRHFATSGAQAPGAPSGAVFAQFGTIPGIGSDFAPDVDAQGEIAFHAVLAGTGVTGTSQIDGNALGIWRSSAAGLALVARQDAPAPGTAAGVEFMGFPTPLVSAPPVAATASTTFVGGLRGPGIDSTFFTNAGGIWSGPQGVPALVARAGEAAPGLSGGEVFRGFGLPYVNASGKLAFNAVWRESGDPPDLIVDEQEGLWSTRSGALAAIVLAGQPAPGAGAGATFGEGTSTAVGGTLRAWDTREALDVAFLANLSGPGITDTNDEGVWIETAGAPALVAREGAPAPGAGAGFVFGISTGFDAFGELIGVRRGANGATLFDARLSGPGVAFLRSLWVHRGGSLDLIARASPAGSGLAGDPAPGLPAGWTFSTLPSAVVDALGRVAFRGTATFQQSTSQLRQGLWREQGGSLSALALAGDPAPGLAGLSLSAFGPALSAAGDGALAFLASLSGPGVGGSNDTALYLADGAGSLHLVAREGSSVVVGGVPRVVARLIVGTIQDSGVLPYELEFTDGACALFTARRQSTPLLVELCPGDGSGTACPCGNDSAAGSGTGCRNSTGAGSRLVAGGTTSVGADDLSFAASGVAPLRSALLYVGTSTVAGGAGAVFGDGLRCAGGTIRRLGLRVSDASGAASWGPGLAPAGAWSAGEIRTFQVWYRDGGGPCGSGFNLGNAVRATFTP